jgi:hypothetical protein
MMTNWNSKLELLPPVVPEIRRVAVEKVAGGMDCRAAELSNPHRNGMMVTWSYCTISTFRVFSIDLSDDL